MNIPTDEPQLVMAQNEPSETSHHHEAPLPPSTIPIENNSNDASTFFMLPHTPNVNAAKSSVHINTSAKLSPAELFKELTGQEITYNLKK